MRVLFRLIVAGCLTLGATLGFADVVITMDNFTFNPPIVTVVSGQVVTWINNDPNTNYRLDSDDKSISSNDIIYQGIYSKIFSNTGIYNYYCANFPFMMGVVKVNSINQYISETVKSDLKKEKAPPAAQTVSPAPVN